MKRTARQTKAIMGTYLLLLFLSLTQIAAGQTVEAVLRGLQERKLMLAVRDKITAELNYEADQKNDNLPPGAQPPGPLTEADLLAWPGELTAFPQDGEITSLKVALSALNMASTELERNIQGKFLFYDPAWNTFFPNNTLEYILLRLPPVGRFTEENWRQKIGLLASNISQLKALSWPLLVNDSHGDTSWSNYEIRKDDDDNDVRILTGLDASIISPATIDKVHGTLSSGFAITRSWRVDDNTGYFGFWDPLFFPWLPGWHPRYISPVMTWSISGIGVTYSTENLYADLSNSLRFFSGVKTKIQPIDWPVIDNVPEADDICRPVKFYKIGSFSSNTDAGFFDVTQPDSIMLGDMLSRQYPDSWSYERAIKIPVPAQTGADVILGELEPSESETIESEYNKLKQWLAFPDISLNGAWAAGDDEEILAILGEDVNGYDIFKHLNHPKPAIYSDSFDVTQSASVGLHCIYEPNFTDLLSASIKHGGIGISSVGSVETRFDDVLRVHLGRGTDDGNQTAWLSSRLDGFGSPIFVGSPTAFELLFETDCTKYTDDPLAVAGVVRGSYDYPAESEFTATDSQNSGFETRYDYLREWHSPRLRQIKGGDVLVDIAYSTSYKKELRFYWLGDAGVKSNGFYSPVTSKAFKKIVIHNPAAPEQSPGLPTSINKLEVIENSVVYHDVTMDYEVFDFWPTLSGCTITKGSSPNDSYSIRTVILEEDVNDSSLIHWKLTNVENSLTTNIVLDCPWGHTPSDTDRPVVIKATINRSGEAQRAINYTYWEQENPNISPVDWTLKQMKCAGPTSWEMNGAQSDFDDEGYLTNEQKYISGSSSHLYQVTHSWDGNKHTSISSLDQAEYRKEEIAYAADFITAEWSVSNPQLAAGSSGSITNLTWDEPGGTAPWALKQIEEPGGHKQTINTSYIQAGNSAFPDATRVEVLSGFGANHNSGTKSVSTTNRFGGLISQTIDTADGVHHIAAASGSDHTPWGLPKTINYLRGVTHAAFNGDSGNQVTGNNYGTLRNCSSLFDATTNFSDYDWLNRPAGWSSISGTFNPDYSDPLKSKVTNSSAGYDIISEFTAFGALKKAENTQGSGHSLDLDAHILQVGGRQASLDISPTGQIAGIKKGLGSRGAVSDIGVDGSGNFCVTTTSRMANDEADYEVKVSYDVHGRVVRYAHPAPNGSVIQETWLYDDANRKVTYSPGPGPVLKTIISTLSADGSVLNVNEGGIDVMRYTRSVEDGKFVTLAEKYDDSSDSGAGWRQFSKQSIDPRQGTETFIPWDLTASKLTHSISTPGASTIEVVSGGASGDAQSTTYANGLSAAVNGRVRGLPFNITTINRQHGRLTGGSGTVAGLPAGFSLDSDGRIIHVYGAGFNKTFTYGGAPEYQITIADSLQNTSQTYRMSDVGDLTEASGSGIQALSQGTTDLGNGQHRSIVNGSLTTTTAAGGELLSKHYSGGIDESCTWNAAGLPESFGIGSAHGTISYDDLRRTTSYPGSSVVDEEFYIAGPRKSVAGPNDHRGFTWLRELLRTESHLGGPWAGAALTRGQDDRGLCNGVAVARSGSGICSFGYAHDQYARPLVVTSGNVTGNYSYDSNTGHVVSCNRGGLTSSWTYDGIGRVTDVDTSGGGSFPYHYTYDQRHRRTSRVAGSGVSWFGMTYDAADRLTHVQLGNGTVLNYSYDARGNRVGGGAAVTYTVNLLDQATLQTAGQRGYGVSGTVAPGAQVRVIHPLAPQGENISNVDPTTGAYSAFWSVSGDWGGGGVTRVEMLVRGTLTGAGNNGTDAISEKDLWVVVPATNEGFQYDDAGRLIEDGTWNYNWNGMNCLIGMTRKTGTSPDATVTDESLTFSYDCDGRRTSKTHTVTHSGGAPRENTSKLLWDGWLPVVEERIIDGTAQPRRWFVWGRDVSGSLDGAGGIGGLLAIQEEGGRTLLPVDDGLGNITAVVNAANGQTVSRYDYGPFGEPVGGSGEAAACPFRFQSKYCDEETGLCYFGYRYYSPRLGRWLSRDPMGEAGGFNLYAYCGNDPVNRHDYLGLASTRKLEEATNEAKKQLRILASLIAQLGGASTSIESQGALTAAGLISEIDTAEDAYYDSLTKAYNARADYLTDMNMWDGLWQSNWDSANAPMALPMIGLPTADRLGFQSDLLTAGSNAIDILVGNAGDAARLAGRIETAANTASFALGVGAIGVQGTRIAMTQGGKALLPFAGRVAGGVAVGVGVNVGVGWAGDTLGFSPEQTRAFQNGLSIIAAARAINARGFTKTTKSSLSRGLQMHRAYKAGLEDRISTFKEYRLHSGRRIDFLDKKNGIIYELKPNNPRAIAEGRKQLQQYVKELLADPDFDGITNWRTVLDTY